MNRLENVIKEIFKYDNAITLDSEVSEGEILSLESKLGQSLPTDFKSFLKRINGLEMFSESIYGIYKNKPGLDLYSNYLWELEESDNPILPHLLPISPDGFGNHYCLDLKSLYDNGDYCNVIFWQHDFEYTAEELPDIVTSSFLGFVEEMFKDIKEHKNYDGTDK
ncbi:MAG: SMI1/KNR4 family protein [Calditrichia bacterium]